MRRATRYSIDLCTFAAVGLAGLLGCHGMGAKTVERPTKPAEKPTRVAARKQEPADPLVRRASAKHKEVEEPAPPEVSRSQKPNQVDPRVAKMSEELDAIATNLATAGKQHAIQFEFETLNNPRPRMHHSPDGHIYVTTGMLGQLNSRDELAGVLALEMAKVVVESKQDGDTDLAPPPAVPRTGPDDAAREQALAAKQSKPQRGSSASDLHAAAREILDHAGFKTIDLPTVETRLRAIAASKPQAGDVPAAAETLHAN